MPLASPTDDASAFLGSGAVPDHEQQSFLALILKKLAQGEAALTGDAVEFRFTVHPCGGAARQDKRCAHHRHRTEPVAQPPGKWGNDDRSCSIDRQNEAGAGSAEVELLREVQHQERKHHRSGPVDQRYDRKDPHSARKSLETSPDVDRVAHGARTLRLPLDTVNRRYCVCPTLNTT